MKTFPTLFKKTKTGAIQQWLIAVDKNAIITTHGQTDGKQQEVQDLIREGKNAGRSNATTPEEQALREAAARHLRQRKKGYVDSVKAAEEGDLDEVIEGGILPMLAESYKDCKESLKFPCAIQPKLDGHRCIVPTDEMPMELWSRSRRRITSSPHIAKQAEIVAAQLGLEAAALDGELYHHKFHDDFEGLSSLLSRKEADEETATNQYHLYDLIIDLPQGERLQLLNQMKETEHIKLVPTRIVQNEAELWAAYEEFMDMGYEGAIARNLDAPYQSGARPVDLLKVIKKLRAEFKIIGMEEGRGKLMGHCGAFVCVKPDGVTFRAKMKGAKVTPKLKEAWENQAEWIGKVMTVEFRGYYKKTGKPRFPVALQLRVDL